MTATNSIRPAAGGKGAMVDEEVLADFLTEAAEHLERAERELLELESFDGSPEEVLDLLNRLFRAVHSIKGAAGFLELKRIVELTHEMENIFGSLREERQKPDAACADLMLEGIDLLRQMLENVHDCAAVATAAAVERLRLYAAQRKAGSATAAATQPTTKTAAAKEDADQEARHGEFYYRIEAADTEAALKNLTGVAQTDGQNQGQLLVSSVLDTDLLQAALDLPQARVTRLNWKAYQQLLAAQRGDNDQARQLANPAVPPQRPAPVAPSASTEKKSVPADHSIRVDLSLLEQLMSLAGELVLVRNRHQRWLAAADSADEAGREIAQRLDTVTTELQTSIMKTRMQPLERVFGKLPRLVREVAKQLGKEIDLRIEGGEVEVDRAILESLADPLTHLLRNSCDHGIELPAQRQAAGKGPSGSVTVSARHESGQIRIDIADDGKGIDPDFIGRRAVEKGLIGTAELEGMDQRRKLSLIMLPGFSTAATVSSISGRGVGMDVVKSSVEKLGGSVEIESAPGRGSRFILRLPLTLAIIQSLIVSEEGRRYLIPRINLEEVINLSGEEIGSRVQVAAGQQVLEYHKSLLQLVRLGDVLRRPEPFDVEERARITREQQRRFRAGEIASLDVAVVRVGERRYGLVVEETQEMEEIVVKPLHPAQENVKIFLGVTVTGDGRVAPILDVEGIARHALDEIRHNRRRDGGERFTARSDDAQKVLLFENAPGEQFAVGLSFIRRIHSLPASSLEKIGPRQYARVGEKPVIAAHLEDALPVSSCPDCEEYYLILPRFGQVGCGILATRLCGIGEVAADFSNSAGEDGLLGTAVINGITTLFPDIYQVCERAMGLSVPAAQTATPAACPPEEDTSESEDNSFAEPEQDAAPVIPAGRRPKRVLLAEDAPFFRQLIMTYLRRENLQVDTVPDGAQAWEQLCRDDYDLVLSDIEMPTMDGKELVRRIRSDQRFRQLPVVALTALDTEEDRQECLDAGFSEYMIKLNREQLLKMLRRYFVS